MELRLQEEEMFILLIRRSLCIPIRHQEQRRETMSWSFMSFLLFYCKIRKDEAGANFSGISFQMLTIFVQFCHQPLFRTDGEFAR
jgi:hypothetical protein